MKALLEYILKGITNSEEISVDEIKEADKVSLLIHAPNEFAGYIIGKGVKTIIAITNILKIKATLEKTVVNVTLADEASK